MQAIVLKNAYSRNNPAEPWQELESGRVAWHDFSAGEQEMIVRHFAPKIKYLALRLKNRLPKSVELSELISAGTLGLMECLGKFQPRLGIKFDTYAENRIRGAMLDDLRRLDWFPRSLRQKVRQVENASARIEASTGRSATEQEIAELTNYSEKEVREAMEAIQNQQCLSLDTLLENSSLASEGLSDNEPYKNAVTAELVDKMAVLIEQLTPREKLVLSLYYTDELNMREAAEVMGVTEGRVSQLHSQALARLRREFHNQFGEAALF
ncbi:MAG: FliA/WhiG family RNA polymerase sigma factor [Desulfovibrionaceae bacterium]|nr:FliA/WhiG family RNA polymerase sigma factor [Desulfovibrionaceae bacterium]